MKKALIAGAALIALGGVAFAQAGHGPGRHGHGHAMGMENLDADEDGWVTRAEMGAAADRMFAARDANSDGKLDDADRQAHREARRERRIERDVRIERRDGEGGRHHGGRRHMGPPMMGMLLLSHEEADVNGDGALSRDEFRNLQLRLFDAADVNGDRRIQFTPPPEPPQPPEPPAPAGE
ncbi:MAG: hypothetical protein GC189_00505 [Alphaproteobacteria bacterium]|nr:hypothetical protein [Alphaproteobacteria bacterium]